MAVASKASAIPGNDGEVRRLRLADIDERIHDAPDRAEQTDKRRAAWAMVLGNAECPWKDGVPALASIRDRREHSPQAASPPARHQGPDSAHLIFRSTDQNTPVPLHRPTHGLLRQSVADDR